MDTILETEHLVLKKPSMEDLRDLCVLLQDPEVSRYVLRTPTNPEEVRDWLKIMIWEHETFGFSYGHVYEKSTSAFVGRAGLTYSLSNDPDSEVKLGYRLHKKFWNKGYGTELAKALIAWGFAHLPVDQLVAVIHPEHEASRRVLEKAGMEYAGRDIFYDIEVDKYFIQRNKLKENGGVNIGISLY